MFRVKIALIVFGGMLVFWGYQQYDVSRGTSSEPVPVDLAQLEAGQPPSNNHVQLGEHIAVYDESIYQYQQSKYSTAEPTDSTSVSFVYYPVISMSHQFVQDVQKIVAEQQAAGSGDAGIGPNSLPPIRTFAVLVKTYRFKRLGDLTGGITREDDLKGLFINQIASLDKDEEKLIRESFPSLDVDRVLILEQDRRPASLVKSFGMIGGGLLLCLVGVGLFFVGNDE